VVFLCYFLLAAAWPLCASPIPPAGHSGCSKTTGAHVLVIVNDATYFAEFQRSVEPQCLKRSGRNFEQFSYFIRFEPSLVRCGRILLKDCADFYDDLSFEFQQNVCGKYL
jgi:hypothetical protein